MRFDRRRAWVEGLGLATRDARIPLRQVPTPAA